MSTHTHLYEQPPVPLPHEHSFTIQTGTWVNPHERTITLRMCSTCGLTHALVFTHNMNFIWEEVKERIAL